MRKITIKQAAARLCNLCCCNCRLYAITGAGYEIYAVYGFYAIAAFLIFLLFSEPYIKL